MGGFTIVRFERGAVVLDPRRGSILELGPQGAEACDLLFDRVARFPATPSDAARERRAVRALRQELLGEPQRGGGIAFDVELAEGEVLLRRHPAPPQWPSWTVAEETDVPARPEEIGGRLSVGLVRALEGALMILGSRSVVARVVEAFAHVSSDALPSDLVTVEAGPPLTIRSATWNGALRPTEVWSVATGLRPGLTRARLAPERALLGLLGAAVGAPDEPTLTALALCAERVPHFSVIVPRDASALSRVIADYWGLALQ